MASFSGEAPLRVLDWALFSAQPARLHCSFAYQDGRHVCDPALVFDLTRHGSCADVRVDDTSDDVVLHVSTCEELCGVLCRLQRQLMLTRVTVYHTEISSRHSVETVSIVEDDFAVLVNFSHPSLSPSLARAAQRAVTCLSRDRHFCLEIDLTEVILDWYMLHRDAITSCDDIHNLRTRRARVCVTNHRAYRHQLDCSPQWIAFLCLCWILFVPCYVIHRKLTCSDIRVKVRCDVSSMGSNSVLGDHKRMLTQSRQTTSYSTL
ncbi:uncharacterized protein LOC143291479 [Babylonia areolata]|uniref:uncharacterized protein LOC143291479 n=1 Tax=Babylonia areolata TaxID=304850 RepID=UPI003FD2975B